ncbi:unnamed protein product [Owenia fusiformis]|uniref:Uncharacterized protein n=1 Tax=Owenia fusiformis TaxID=6347 RepID=A0A8J1U7Q0_OWEFU|nr:unnamed protein product [Owenia fusiformis]
MASAQLDEPINGEHSTPSKSKGSLECPECGKRFSRTNTLDKHILSHSTKKPHVCVDCGKEFQRSDHLSKHMAVHSTIKPFPCDFCEKAFARKDHMQRHMRLHSDSRPFECSICNEVFSRKDHLNNHTKRVHTSDSPSRTFVCHACDAAFKRKDQLQRHEKKCKMITDDFEAADREKGPVDLDSPQMVKKKLKFDCPDPDVISKHIDEAIDSVVEAAREEVKIEEKTAAVITKTKKHLMDKYMASESYKVAQSLAQSPPVFPTAGQLTGEVSPLRCIKSESPESAENSKPVEAPPVPASAPLPRSILPQKKRLSSDMNDAALLAAMGCNPLEDNGSQVEAHLAYIKASAKLRENQHRLSNNSSPAENGSPIPLNDSVVQSAAGAIQRYPQSGINVPVPLQSPLSSHMSQAYNLLAGTSTSVPLSLSNITQGYSTVSPPIPPTVATAANQLSSYCNTNGGVNSRDASNGAPIRPQVTVMTERMRSDLRTERVGLPLHLAQANSPSISDSIPSTTKAPSAAGNIHQGYTPHSYMWKQQF